MIAIAARKGAVTIRDIVYGFSSRCRPSSSTVKNWVSELLALGFIVTVADGKFTVTEKCGSSGSNAPIASPAKDTTCSRSGSNEPDLVHQSEKTPTSKNSNDESADSVTVANQKTPRDVSVSVTEAIAADIAFERFDFSLTKYQPQIQAIDDFPLTLGELWEKYTAYKTGHLAITTINKDFKRVAAHIASLPSQALRDARKIRRHLMSTRTSGATKKSLMQINACCQWRSMKNSSPEIHL